MSKNLKAKTRPESDPYETFVSVNGEWIYKALKHYQSPEAEAKNPFARVFFSTTSPYVEGELGDGYLHEVLAHTIQTQGETIGFDPLPVPEF